MQEMTSYLLGRKSTLSVPQTRAEGKTRAVEAVIISTQQEYPMAITDMSASMIKLRLQASPGDNKVTMASDSDVRAC